MIPVSIAFTAQDWGMVRTLTVTAVDDQVQQGIHTGAIAHTSTSNDPLFNALALPTVAVTIADNDTVQDIRSLYDRNTDGLIDKQEAIAMLIDYLLQKANPSLGRPPIRSEAITVMNAYLLQQSFAH